MKTAILLMLLLATLAWGQNLNDRHCDSLMYSTIDSLSIDSILVAFFNRPLGIDTVNAETTIVIIKADTIWDFGKCPTMRDSLKTAIWKLKQLEKPPVDIWRGHVTRCLD